LFIAVRSSAKLVTIVPVPVSANCVTVTKRVSPPPVTVTVPVRLASPLLAVTLSLNVPLPVLLLGVTFETVSHDVLLLVGLLHVMFDVTVIVVLLASGPGFHVVGESSRIAGACVTVTLSVRPPPVTVTIAFRSAPVLFAVALSLNEPLPVLLLGVTFETVSHDWSLLGVFHVVFDVTEIVVLLANGPGFHSVGESVKTAVGFCVHWAYSVMFAVKVITCPGW